MSADRRQDGHGAADEFRCECRQTIELTLRPAKFDRRVAAIDISDLGEAIAEGSHDPYGIVG
jgi:hypothetical protein